MNWSFLFFLSEPWFVLAWYAIGALGACYVIYDMHNNNTALKPAMKWAWPIIVFFFSVIGMFLYFATARPPGIERIEDDEEKQDALDQYEQSSWRRVNGAVIHCVAGDGFGIMTAMVIARAASMSFWQEFWFEYIVGFSIGWFIFQRKSMTMMTDSLPKQLAMAFRGEFFSMLTVMGGMGAVMAYVTPMVVTQQPKPLTAAFWGFGMLGLLVGYIFTFPMNWMMVKLGWKHGLGPMKGAERMQVEKTPARIGIVSAMVVLGCFGLFVPTWLVHVRERAPIQNLSSATQVKPELSIGQALEASFKNIVEDAKKSLEKQNWTQAAQAMDSALRVAEVGTHSAPGSFYSALEQIRNARLALQQGQTQQVIQHLTLASATLIPVDVAFPNYIDVDQYRGARVINQKGQIIGEVKRISGNSFELSLGGWHNAWGFIDFGSQKRVSFPVRDLAFGPPRAVGMKLVAVPTAVS